MMLTRLSLLIVTPLALLLAAPGLKAGEPEAAPAAPAAQPAAEPVAAPSPAPAAETKPAPAESAPKTNPTTVPPVPAAEPAKPVPAPPADWLNASGRPAAEEQASPEAAMRWAGQLAAESSFSAASRAYEGLVRRWPGAAEAPAALAAAARTALSAGEFDRAEGLLNELRNRWRTPENAAEQDGMVVLLAETRLAEVAGGKLAPSEAERQCHRAIAAFQAVLEKDKAGPLVERAALGKARAQIALGRTTRGINALDQFLRDYPRSPLIPEARSALAAAHSAKAHGRPPEGSVLGEAHESAAWARQQAGSPAGAIDETYKAIAARQAELKIDEARLYLRLRQRRAAETVLRSVLGHYGDTPAAEKAAKLLEELARQ